MLLASVAIHGVIAFWSKTYSPAFDIEPTTSSIVKVLLESGKYHLVD